ncbi:glycosyltransferase [Nostoc sp. NMS4]|uniref:glycosyltransferase n=1 Tax=Nostoc sp. NMS4 TaxID=2815390 RepID=UPI0025E62F6E|nr:glycosyltransferase [Nostoc sp. NMS4]MBN3926991.1 glycosyltransferase [Nostoc sp. NMS4]
MRLLMVQYAGDYREAVERLAKSGGETYYAQKYSVDAVAEIGKTIEEAAVLCCLTQERYDEVLSNGVRAIGAGFNQKIPIKPLIELIEKQNPTHLIVRTPIPGIFRWAIKNKVPTIAILADSFKTQGFKNKIRNYWLAKLLNHQRIEWVFNHGINSSLSLLEIGINPDKIIPWDWPATITPDSFPAKMLRADGKTWNLVYVGLITESKGIGDVLDALKELKEKNFSINLKVAGKGETEEFINKAKQLNIENCVEFLGLVPNQAIVHLMREADLVIIPSRPDYPEGFPMTIYEALCSRTPIIASDHPMFQNKLKDGINSVIFPAANSVALADCVEKLISNPELYERISLASYEAWKQLQIPVKWAEMINRWLDNSPPNQQWLFEHRLSSGHYN